MNREKAIKELQDTLDWIVEEYYFDDKPYDGNDITSQVFNMAIKALEIIGDLEKALPTICTTQFEAYAYYKVLELDEVEE